jgi:hypothetical protein
VPAGRVRLLTAHVGSNPTSHTRLTMKMKIGIFGDSFADYHNSFTDSENESWMHFLKKETKSEVDVYGHAGTSLWYSFDLFLKNYKKYSHIVFCFTNPHRIHSIPGKFRGLEHVKDPDFLQFLSKQELDFRKIFLVYWKYLFNEEFDIFVCQQMFEKVQEICKDNNIKIVSILPFELPDHCQISYNLDKKQGDCYIGLNHVVCEEVERSSTKKFPPGGDRRYCHLTKENNFIFSKMIHKSLDSEEKTIYNLSDKQFCNKTFVFKKQNLDRYFY